MEEPQEERICKGCGVAFPLSQFYYHRNIGKPYYKGKCKECYRKMMIRSRIKARVKARMKKRLPEAQKRAALRMLERYPEVLASLIARNKPMYEHLLMQEKRAIINEMKRDALKFGFRTDERGASNVEFVMDAYNRAAADLGIEVYDESLAS